MKKKLSTNNKTTYKNQRYANNSSYIKNVKNIGFIFLLKPMSYF